MHLKQVTLRNFRCFEDLAIPLHPRLTVLVAENGGGKTSILDGIAIGLSPILRYLSSANQRLSGPGFKDTDFRLIPVQDLTKTKWVASDYSQVVVETSDGLVWDHSDVSSKGKGKQPPQKVGQTHLAAALSATLDSIKTPHPRLLPIFAYYGAKRGWMKMPERLRESKINYDFPTSALLGCLDSFSDFREMLKWFDLEESSELRASKEEFNESPALSAVRIAISTLLGGRYSHPGFDRGHKFVIQSDTEPGVLRVSQLSQGYQSMLALAMDFARRLALGNPQMEHFGDGADWEQPVRDFIKKWNSHEPNIALIGTAWSPAVMLIDEVDLHLHPEWQQRVLTDLMRAFPATQFVVASHSPQVLSTVPMESILIIKGGKTYSAPPGTDGAAAQRILEDVFKVPARAKTEMSSALDEYLRLVDLRQWDSARALELRTKLDEWSKGHEPRLTEADLQIENLKWETGK